MFLIFFLKMTFGSPTQLPTAQHMYPLSHYVTLLQYQSPFKKNLLLLHGSGQQF